MQLADQVVQLPPAASMQYVNETTGATFATLAEAATLGGGVDEINAVMAVEELGELVEASEGIEPGTPGIEHRRCRRATPHWPASSSRSR